MEGSFFFFHKGVKVFITITPPRFIGRYHRICVNGNFRECETNFSCAFSEEDVQECYADAKYISYQEIEDFLKRTNARYIWEQIDKIIETEENQMKPIVLTSGASAIVKMVESADIEKIKTEYPGWEISVLTPETGEIELEAKAYGYDQAFAEIKVVE